MKPSKAYYEAMKHFEKVVKDGDIREVIMQEGTGNSEKRDWKDILVLIGYATQGGYGEYKDLYVRVCEKDGKVDVYSVDI